jgi:hypothetical protein
LRRVQVWQSVAPGPLLAKYYDQIKLIIKFFKTLNAVGKKTLIDCLLENVQFSKG